MTRRQLQTLISQIPEDAEILIGETGPDCDVFLLSSGAALSKDTEGTFILWGVQSRYEVSTIENEWNSFSEWIGKTGIPEV